MASISKFHPLILADAHVHLHRFDITQVFDAACANFRAVARRSPMQAHPVGVLFLTEMQGEQRFQALYDTASASTASNALAGRWSVRRTQEPMSLIAQHPEGDRLILLAGRQIVTQEKLEVLALITEQSFEDGHSLVETVKAISAAGGVTVLPWGVGKWLGRRGKLLQQMLESNSQTPIHLGDNSGRPMFWSRPSYFNVAEQRGWRVLPGTDPLPLLSESARPGKFGFALAGTIDWMQPGNSIKALLNSPTPLQPYGQLETPFRFVWNQVSLRLQKAI